MDVVCEYCSALHWHAERLASSTSTHSSFGLCCLQGKIRLPLLKLPPPALQSLFEEFSPLANSFRTCIRSYNAANAFTSLGVAMDERILSGRGPTAFTIHGELRHRIGSLLPAEGVEPNYAQLYIYDASTALAFRESRNPHLRNDVLGIINTVLLETNDLCRLYRRAFEILSEVALEDHAIPASLHYTPGTDPRCFNLPTTNEIAVILPGDENVPITTRDLILRLQDGPLLRISECHPAYWPSHYVLFFPYGELGWHPDMKQWNVSEAHHTGSRLTQLQYSAYRLFERLAEYSSILRGGDLFQEFIVDAWAAYEQNRLQYVRTHQTQLRSEVYTGLADSMNTSLNPRDIGRHLILPSSHPGSPRNMYEIYQDSMAITRYN
ncbi:hypothetical protein AQUCO_00200011v1 [Aquilegia coerulea]|uniref:Helitron helicase-like domain-containing protein n=1 Tax=Aquilegia coerulea TaxID=218851 RepID=A0A2G5F179_AQUCA|nr:hypothetical protein AQUCO_00200011v1 [Aquilegia coerulea]